MASTLGNLSVVQNTYVNNPSRGYAGQLVSVTAATTTIITTNSVTEDIPMGRGVVVGVQQFQEPSGNTPFTSTQPFSVSLPDAGSVAADLVGITVHQFITAQNVDDGSGSNQVAGYCARFKAAIVPFGSQLEVYVNIPDTFTVSQGDPVYIAIQVPNAAAIELGAFTNAADGGNTLLVPNAQWWINKTATTDNTIGVIKLF